MDYNKWKKKMRTGGYRRKVTETYQKLMKRARYTAPQNTASQISLGQSGSQENEGFVESIQDNSYEDNDNSLSSSLSEPSDDESDTSEKKKEVKNYVFRRDVKKWALSYNISHAAINELAIIVNKRLPDILPKDARTLLKTNKEIVEIVDSGQGQYWHSGLMKQLNQIFERLSCTPDIIYLNINIDGLPVYKSSRQQLWPILCNIFEMPNLPPFVIGIYAGDAKPSDLETYLGPFVHEMKQLEDRLTITPKTGTEKIIQVQIRAFICDSPARALIKGVCNYNGKNGCLKCNVVGDYSHKSNTVTFPKFDCPKRTDQDFRARKYGEHHKQDSPLLKLKIDMIEDFPVSDSLHLIDLGLMKRLLMGWRDGNFGTYLTKWRASDIEKVNSFLRNCQMPKEIHRAVRAIDVLAHWKGSEYRCFLHYLSFIILKEVLRTEAYCHFMHLFCAITICSNEKHFQFLEIAKGMLEHFCENFKVIYGKDYVTSNIHNLSHLVDEVRKFGILQSFNAYPFENKLYGIKSMIRQGNKPLHQVARRINEKQLCEIENLKEDGTEYPFLKKVQRGQIGMVLNMKSFILSSKKQDRWFLSDENYVIELIYVGFKNDNEKDIEIHGYRIENACDAFEEPLKSSFLNIYRCDNSNLTKTKHVYNVSNVKCKLISVLYNESIYFIPLLHTLS